MNCFVLERKHKGPKEYGTDIKNTDVYEKSVLHEVICDHLSALSDPKTFDFERVCLHNPHKAVKKVREFMLELLALPLNAEIDLMQSVSARCSSKVTCAVGDIVLYSARDGDFLAGEVCALLSLGDTELFAIVLGWELESAESNVVIWRTTDQARHVTLPQIEATLVWMKLGARQVKTILPPRFR